MESLTNSRINRRFTETGAPPNDVPFLDDYLNEPLVSLEKALRELSSHVKRLNYYREYAQTNCNFVFSRCSQNNQIFRNSNGQNTLFTINTVNGKNISAYSRFPDELEVILLPGTRFRVTGKHIEDIAPNCTNVLVTHLQEL